MQQARLGPRGAGRTEGVGHKPDALRTLSEPPGDSGAVPVGAAAAHPPRERRATCTAPAVPGHSATGARRRGTLCNGTRWSAYSSGQRCGAARACITYRTASRSTSPPRPMPPRRTRRPAEQRPPRQTADEMIARIKGQEKRFRTPKRTNKPPTHPTTTGSTKATTRSCGVRSSRGGLLRHQTGASL